MKIIFKAILLILFVSLLSGVCYAEGETSDAQVYTLDVPSVAPMYYTGESQTPDISASPLYTVDTPYARCAGVYYATLTLTDPERYKWRGTDESTITVEFEILKSYNVFTEPIRVFDISVDSSDFFSARSRFGYARFEYSSSPYGEYCDLPPDTAGVYYARAVVDETEDYYGIASEPIAFEIFAPAEEANGDFDLTPWLFLLIGLLGVASLVLIVIASRSTVECELTPEERVTEIIPDENEDDDDPQLVLTLSEDIPIRTAALDVTPERADGLISDSLASAFIKKSPSRVTVSGTSREQVSIGVISERFESGARVDISALKERGIIGRETSYVRVVAKGKIDKPLRIFANDFELCAVKMIVLTGGEAYKTVCGRRKK